MEKEAVKHLLAVNLREIESISNQILLENGMPYQAKAGIEWTYFPVRTYGDCTFPAGWYEAFRICLGEARGQNWWCMLYPQLCFSDCLQVVEETANHEEYTRKSNEKGLYDAENTEKLRRKETDTEGEKAEQKLIVGDTEKRKLEELLTVEEYETVLRQPDQWKFCFRWF